MIPLTTCCPFPCLFFLSFSSRLQLEVRRGVGKGGGGKKIGEEKEGREEGGKEGGMKVRRNEEREEREERKKGMRD